MQNVGAVGAEVFYTNAWLQLVLNQPKFYLGASVGNFKQRFYNHKKYFNNSTYRNETALSNYDIKEKYNETSILK